MKLSARSIGLLALICLAGIAQQWGAADAVVWWRYCAAALVLGLLYEWRLTRAMHTGIQLQSSGNDQSQLRLGRAETLCYRLVNSGARYWDISFTPNLPADFRADETPRRLRLASGKTALLEFEITARELGRYDWHSMPARIRGALGLAQWPTALLLDAQLEVVPDIVGAKGAAMGTVQQGDRITRPGAGLELHQLREYVQGDPLRAINWKATARSQKLVTQVFSEEQHLDIMLVLDVGRTSRTRVDGMSQLAHYTNLVSTFTAYAVAAGDSVGLVVAADTTQFALPPQRGNAAVRQINTALRNLRSEPVETDMLAAAMTVQRLARNRCLVILATDLYSQTLSGDFGRSLKLWGRRHMPFVVGLIGADVIALAQQKSNDTSDAYASLAASEYSISVQANARAAQRLGAQAIVARPQELQSRVLETYRLLKAQRRV